MSEAPSYYAIIPASVRYADITPNAKLLYGEITALCSKSGVCWASNGYFASLYQTTDRSIQRWLGELKEAGFIAFCESPMNPNARGIKLAEAPPDKIVVPPDRSVGDPPDNFVTHNNTQTNNTTLPPTGSPQPTKATTRENRGQRLEQYYEQFGLPADTNSIPVEWSNWCVEQFSWERRRAWQIWLQFRDYWRSQPGQRGVKADWFATWRNWCRREAERQPHGGGSQRSLQSPGGNLLAAGMRALAELKRRRNELGGQSGAGQGSDETDPFGFGEGTPDAVPEQAKRIADASAGGNQHQGSDEDVRVLPRVHG